MQRQTNGNPLSVVIFDLLIMEMAVQYPRTRLSFGKEAKYYQQAKEEVELS